MFAIRALAFRLLIWKRSSKSMLLIPEGATGLAAGSDWQSVSLSSVVIRDAFGPRTPLRAPFSHSCFPWIVMGGRAGQTGTTACRRQSCWRHRLMMQSVTNGRTICIAEDDPEVRSYLETALV